MSSNNTNNLLFLGISILVVGLFLLSYSITTYKEVQSLANKIDFEELDNNNQMSSSDKYFKYLSISDYLNQILNKNKNLLMKNSACVYLDYAQHNAISLYKLTYNGVQTEETRKSVAAGNIRNLYTMLDNYKTCKQTENYKTELKNILDDIQKTDNLYSEREQRMESFMKDYNAKKEEQPSSEEENIEEQYQNAGIAEDEITQSKEHTPQVTPDPEQ